MVVIRTDSSTTIGRGHVMRCLTLADSLRERGVHVRFVCKTYRGNLISALTARGHDVFALPLDGRDDVPYTEWQDPEWERDAEQTIAGLADQMAPVDWLIVDSYALSAPWETTLRKAARHIMVIDDHANRAHDCELLLDQNLHRDLTTRYDGLVPTRCRRLLGPQYALLRPEFRAARAKLRYRDGVVRRILIFFGGSDTSNESSKALQAVNALNRPDIEVDVIIGAMAPNLEHVRSSCATLSWAHFHRDPDNIAELMVAADLSIGAAGATTWERCCLGLPSIVISLATNQESIAQGLADNWLGIYLGRRESVTTEQIAITLQDLLADGGRVSRLARACSEWVDGDGTSRTASALGTFRPR